MTASPTRQEPDIVQRLRDGVSPQSCIECERDSACFVRCGRGDCVEEQLLRQDAAKTIDALRAALDESQRRVRELEDENEVLAEKMTDLARAFSDMQERAIAAESRERAAREDAERFVFEHSNPHAMISIETAALSGNNPRDINWWRAAIDKARKERA